MADLFGTPEEGLEETVARSLDILERVEARFKPDRVIALFSGGHDSLCATHLASRFRRFDGVAHINTGIGVEETREFVRTTCARYGWPLRELTPPLGARYEDVCRKFGVPGKAMHQLAYNYLKDRAVRQLVRESKSKPRGRVMLVSGARKGESARRMGHAEEVWKTGCQVWASPIVHWMPTDKNRYMAAEGLPRNEVVDVLCMSGECLCGAFAKPNEIIYIEKFYPRAAAEIRRCEAVAKEAGRHCIWGTHPDPVPGAKDIPGQRRLPLCWSCEAKGEREENEMKEFTASAVGFPRG